MGLYFKMLGALMTDHDLLRTLFDAAIDAADPSAALAKILPPKPKGRTVVVGAGKGVAQLAAAFETLWGERVDGVVVTRYGYSAWCKHITVREAAHPVPDDAGYMAARELFAAVSNLTADDLVVALITGGGSALLPAPIDGLDLSDEQDLNAALLASGAPIGVMNMIRKQISTIKGGRLAAAAYPAQVISFVVSDVPGDDPAQVASGPTVADWTTREQALRAIENYGIKLPQRVAAALQRSPETAPLPDDPRFARNKVYVIASAQKSLEAAAKRARDHGLDAVILSDAIEGEARDVAKVHGAIARAVKTRHHPFVPPVVILSGGETTVTLRHKGKGGRNGEFQLALSLELDSIDGVTALAADTDGIDGSETNAGAFVDATSASRMRQAGIDPLAALAQNDSWSAFNVVEDLFEPGPTGTNVNDFRAIIIRD